MNTNVLLLSISLFLLVLLYSFDSLFSRMKPLVLVILKLEMFITRYK